MGRRLPPPLCLLVVPFHHPLSRCLLLETTSLHNVLLTKDALGSAYRSRWRRTACNGGSKRSGVLLTRLPVAANPLDIKLVLSPLKGSSGLANSDILTLSSYQLVNATTLNILTKCVKGSLSVQSLLRILQQKREKSSMGQSRPVSPTSPPADGPRDDRPAAPVSPRSPAPTRRGPTA